MDTVFFPSHERGSLNHGWLQANHTFSFGHYFDPRKMGFGSIRVFNDDYIAPLKGFGTHSHQDMEIVTIPLAGELTHKDSLGNEEAIKYGEVQRMSAGSGISHSEYNNHHELEVNTLQIWILPKKLGIEPNYEQKVFSKEERFNHWQLLVSPIGEGNSLSINQDAYISIGEFNKKTTYQKHRLQNGLFVFLISGSIDFQGNKISSRDAIGLKNIDDIEFNPTEKSEILIIETPL